MNKLKGLIAAPHTPFDSNNQVNYAVIDQIAALLIEQGVTGAYVCGTTGEGIHCSVEERKAIAERWVKAADGKLDGSGTVKRLLLLPLRNVWRESRSGTVPHPRRAAHFELIWRQV